MARITERTCTSTWQSAKRREPLWHHAQARGVSEQNRWLRDGRVVVPASDGGRKQHPAPLDETVALARKKSGRRHLVLEHLRDAAVRYRCYRCFN